MSARPDLCGGHWATGVPTAIASTLWRYDGTRAGRFQVQIGCPKSETGIEKIARPYCMTASVASFRGATPERFSFRIAVPTDRVRDRMRDEPEFYQQLCGALLRAGYPEDAVPFVHFRIESQETVDRDYGGSWAEEAEMP